MHIWVELMLKIVLLPEGVSKCACFVYQPFDIRRAGVHPTFPFVHNPFYYEINFFDRCLIN